MICQGTGVKCLHLPNNNQLFKKNVSSCSVPKQLKINFKPSLLLLLFLLLLWHYSSKLVFASTILIPCRTPSVAEDFHPHPSSISLSSVVTSPSLFFLGSFLVFCPPCSPYKFFFWYSPIIQPHTFANLTTSPQFHINVYRCV